MAEFTAATADLRRAFAAPDPAVLAAPLARLASAAADLADPFMTTAPDADEIAGARAAYEELFDGAALHAAAMPAGDLTAAAIALATESAARRAAVETAAANGDDATLASLRAERLSAAVALANAAALQAWTEASTTLPTHATVALWPNPARGAVRLSFTLAKAGAAHVEVLDVTGRRLVARDLGTRVAGEQSLVLDAATVDALPAGSYFVRVHTPGGVLGGRMIRVAR